MNLKDEIVEEVRAAREAYAARFHYDLAEMYKDLKAKEQARDRNIATLQTVEPLPGTAVSKLKQQILQCVNRTGAPLSNGPGYKRTGSRRKTLLCLKNKLLI